MLPKCSREYLAKSFLGEHVPKPPSELTATPLDSQISVSLHKTQSHA